MDLTYSTYSILLSPGIKRRRSRLDFNSGMFPETLGVASSYGCCSVGGLSHSSTRLLSQNTAARLDADITELDHAPDILMNAIPNSSPQPQSLFRRMQRHHKSSHTAPSVVNGLMPMA
jgi:hypothetical protein